MQRGSLTKSLLSKARYMSLEKTVQPSNSAKAFGKSFKSPLLKAVPDLCPYPKFYEMQNLILLRSGGFPPCQLRLSRHSPASGRIVLNFC